MVSLEINWKAEWVHFICSGIEIQKWYAGLKANYVTGPVGLVTPRIYWSCKIITGPINFSLTEQEKISHKNQQQHLFLFMLCSFISKIFEDIFAGKLVNKIVPKSLLAL